MIQPGELDANVTIRRYAEVADAQGGFVRTYSDFATDVPARIRIRTGRELSVSERVEARATYEVALRFRSDLRPSDVVLWNGYELNIRSGLPGNPRAPWLVLQCELGAAI